MSMPRGFAWSGRRPTQIVRKTMFLNWIYGQISTCSMSEYGVNMGENNNGRQNMLGSDTHGGSQSVAEKSGDYCSVDVVGTMALERKVN